jgi:O-antigen/teichoic acid export membrane protein
VSKHSEARQATDASALTSGRLLARNTIWNLVGETVPLFAALVAIPLLIKGIGVARFGILALASTMVGYMGLFDFGLGRAASKLIAEALGAGRRALVSGLFWTSLYLMAAFGACGALLLALFTAPLVTSALPVPTALRTESAGAFYLLALSLPFVISAASLRGTLAAFQRFDLINAVRIPQGIFTVVGPVLVLPFSRSLIYLVAAMVLVRSAGWLAMLTLCVKVLPKPGAGTRLDLQLVKPLLSFGGWVTVSGVVSPLMVELDRFLIAAMLSVGAVAYYAVPYQVITKLLIVPQAVVGVLFPAFSAAFAYDRTRAKFLFDRGVKYIFLALFAPVMLAVTFAPEALRFWLGSSFSEHSSGVLRWLAIGVLTNSLAHVPFALVQAAHRPDLTAKLHVAELPFYLAFLWLALRLWGLDGAAAAWTARVSVDALVLFVMAARVMPTATASLRQTGLLACAAMACLTAAWLTKGAETKVVFSVGILTFSTWAGWRWVLGREERSRLKRLLRHAHALVS